jgi:1,4-alpha-glucan branching enzyme
MSHFSITGPANLNRYSSKKTSKPINFVCIAPDAQFVSLVGDFNDWDPKANPMRQTPDRAWHAQIPLTHGHHHYQFIVDGKATLDPKAQGVARNEKNEKVSLLAVS